MKNLSKNYSPEDYEDKIYKEWESSGLFSPKIDKTKEPFTISMPPPNATGTLHLGHAVMLALEDIMVRFHRMKGHPTLWIPGTDHAAIATQNKVEQLIAKDGLKKEDLGRKKFISEVKKYVKGSQSTIRNQVRKMGSSCDWTRERYTLDDGLSKAVAEVFVKMYKDDLIYRGDRIVNWCPRCQSTLADDEVDYKDEIGKLYWIKYGPFVLATTRPETKLGDTAVAVHPNDKRYKKMIGKKFMIPGVLGEFEVVVVGDKAVDPEFGSGAIKVTPSHSFVDFEIAQRHKIKGKKIINEEGRMMSNCGKYEGMTTLEARKEIVKDMKKLDLIEKIEEHAHKLSICYRCSATIEPLTSRQWFIDVNKKLKSDLKNKKIELKGDTIKEVAVNVIKDKQIEIVPDRFNKTYYHWMENLRDWCISRQIWWGHPIPVFYCQDCDEMMVLVENPGKCIKCSSEKIKQDPDTLDTWFSSGLWTFSTLGWPEKTEELEYFHPTSVMETGYDILFFWVARMIIMSTYALGDIPFKKVYLHGLIRDRDGRKMSKSLGNGIDPLKMISQYGTDAVRLSLVIGTTPGNDMRMYEEKIAGFRNYVNKIWNASRFVLMNLEGSEKGELKLKDVKSLADKWILSRLNILVKEVTVDLDKMRFSEAGNKSYDFFWGLCCDWYLEIAKGEHKNPKVLRHVLEVMLKLLHPFMPFVTEVVWKELENDGFLMVADWPTVIPEFEFKQEEKEMEFVLDVIKGIRKARSENKVNPGKKIKATVYAGKRTKVLEEKCSVIERLARLESLDILEKGPKIKQSIVTMVGGCEIYLPLDGMLDLGKEKVRIEKEIMRIENVLKGVKRKLDNKGFVVNAPAIVIKSEKEKLEKMEETLLKLKDQLKDL